MKLDDFPFLRAIDEERIIARDFKNFGAVGLIKNEQNEFLVHLRDNKDWIAHPNKWAFIGGVVEEGEEPSIAFIRECEEEVSLKVEKPKALFSLVDIEGSQNLIYVFLAKTKAKIEELTLNEGQDFGFFSLKDLGIMDLVPFAKDLVSHINKYPELIEE